MINRLHLISRLTFGVEVNLLFPVDSEAFDVAGMVIFDSILVMEKGAGSFMNRPWVSTADILT